MPGQEGKAQREPIHGVFSTMEIRKVGTGTTQRKTKVKQYWLVREVHENGEDLAEVQPINEHLIPIGKKRTISVGTLLERFSPEPEFYISNQIPAPSEGEGSAILDLDDGELPAPPHPGTPRAEIEGFELSGAPEEMEKSARASFGLGLTYLKRGNQDKAEGIFLRLAEVDAPFSPAHKHMFNEFGISLRKEKLLGTALKHYLRALDLAPDEDENLLHNIARAYFEQRDFGNAVLFLEKSLQANPNLKESQLFLDYIQRRRKKSSAPIQMSF
ncbi:tetratricopeptide repeat protein [Desulfocurvus sp. DL9XJH121]